ncbi:MAG: type II toxin-antitoxin system HicA family toxin [Dehalococcoidia bacterium]
MKLGDVERHLRSHGCELLRQGGRHAMWWNTATGERQAVPRHQEIGDQLVRRICRRLSVPTA